MKTTRLLYGILGVALVGLGIWLLLSPLKQVSAPPVVTSFETCVSAGYPVMESFPRQCRASQGPTYVEDIGTIAYANASADLITVELPYPGAVTGKEFSVIGKARGGWFFEASFPVEVLDSTGTVLATVPAQADGDWMTPEFVSFKADIKIPDSYTGPALLVLRKDNPSGLPENEASVSFPITVEY